MNDLAVFCRMIRERSSEHRQAFGCLHELRCFGLLMAMLRQELDSMVRVIYLLSIADREYRWALIQASVQGRPWHRSGTKARIADREMVDLADELQGWTKSVYSFGCAFIHLSSCHDYRSRDPMGMISPSERKAIVDHMRHYHGGPSGPDITFQDILPYLPMVFEKIAGNLECYVAHLESDGDLDT